MKILITGGAGYIGTELVRECLQAPEIQSVTVYDNFSRDNHGLFLSKNKKNVSKIKIVDGDILDAYSFKKHIDDVDAVVHLAGKVLTPYYSEDPHPYDQVNHWGTAQIVDAIEKSKVKKFIYLSTTAVYGFSNEQLDEKSVPSPSMVYSMSKYRGENQVRRLFEKKDMKTFILRSGNVFGFSPSIRFDAVINKLVLNAKYFKKIQLYGSGEQKRPFVFIRDLVNVIVHLLGSDHVESGLHNVFTENLRVSDIINILEEIVPGLEKQYLNQHVTYGSSQFAANPFIDEILKDRKTVVREEIKNFFNVLSF